MNDYTKGLVSIITPCYNGAHLIPRLLDSVLAQDYPTVEMFVVDDGSTDTTIEVVEGYAPSFEAHGYTLRCLRQEHQGQSAALNLGLKQVKGEYLLWPDSDDHFTPPHAISTFVEAFCGLSGDFAVVRSIPRFVDEHTGQLLNWDIPIDFGEQQFENILTGQNFYIVPINYIIRLAAFDKVCPGRNIYTGRRPQNIQILEPLLYEYKCHTIRQQLSTVVVRNTSDSHSVKSVDDQLDDIAGFIDLHIHTLINIATMPVATKLMHMKAVAENFLNIQYTYAVRNGRDGIARNLYQQMGEARLHTSWKNKILHILMHCSPRLLHWIVRHF